MGMFEYGCLIWGWALGKETSARADTSLESYGQSFKVLLRIKKSVM